MTRTKRTFCIDDTHDTLRALGADAFETATLKPAGGRRASGLLFGCCPRCTTTLTVELEPEAA